MAPRDGGILERGARLEHDHAVSPARAGNLWSRRSNALWESVFGRLNVWLNCRRTLPLNAFDATSRTTQPTRTRRRRR